MILDTSKLQADLIRDEGFRTHPYADTVGKLTIGVGRNLTDNGLSHGEVMAMLANDIARVTAELDSALPWWRSMADARQRAMVSFAFSGIGTVQGFPKMLAAMVARDFNAAAAELLNSHYAAQVGDRARRLAAMIREG